MKTFRSLVVVRQPVEEVWTTVRDRLPDLVDRVDDVDRVRVLEREELADGKLRLVNEWWAAQRIPDVVARAVGGGAIGWVDRARWDARTHVVEWAIDPLVLADAIDCGGETRYEEAMGGQGTRVTVSGSFDLDAAALGSSSGPLQRPIASFVESVASSLIPRSTRSLVQAAAHLLGEDGR